MTTIEFVKYRRKKKFKCQVTGKVRTSTRVKEIGRLLRGKSEERDLMEVERPPLMQPPPDSLSYLF